MRFFVLFISLIGFSAITAQNHQLLSWQDLEPKLDFEDPFEKLDMKYLYELGELAYYREIEKVSKDELTAYERARKDTIVMSLEAANIDYEYLFKIRPKIEAQRLQMGNEVRKDLDNKLIEISGYLLPLNFEQGKSNEFLLVPWVGACIHTPAPPKNQIIYVKTNGWVDSIELYDPVTISGKLVVSEKVSELFLGDGTMPINTGYSMDMANVFKL